MEMQLLAMTSARAGPGDLGSREHVDSTSDNVEVFLFRCVSEERSIRISLVASVLRRVE